MSTTSEAVDGCKECVVTCSGYAEKKRVVTKIWRAEDEGDILTCDPWKPIDPTKTVYYWHIEFNDYSTTVLNRKCDKALTGAADYYLKDGVTTELDMALSSAMTAILGGCTNDPDYVPDMQVGEVWTVSMTFSVKVTTYGKKGADCPPPFVVVTPGPVTIDKDRP